MEAHKHEREKMRLHRAKTHNQSGVSLIVVVAVMMSLSIMAITFVRMMLYERAAANNYSTTVDARFTALAGLDRAIAEISQRMREGVSWGDKEKGTPCAICNLNHEVISYPYSADSSLADLAIASKKQQPELGLPHISLEAGTRGNFYYSGFVGPGRYEPQGNFYSLKIASNAGKFNINSHIHISEYSGDARQTISSMTFQRILNNLAKHCGIVTAADAKSIADAIALKSVENGKRWNNMAEVELKISKISTEALRKKVLANLCADSWIDTKTYGVYNTSERPISEGSQQKPPSYYSEWRAPVDVNSASNELITALISSIKGYAMFYDNQGTQGSPDRTFIEDGSVTDTGEKLFKTETELHDAPVYTCLDFSYDDDKIAKFIAGKITSRVTVPRFQDRAEFEKFVDEDLNLSDAGMLPARPAHIRDDATWESAWLDALKSNFNPNVIDNIWNPNKPAYRRVCRGDLFVNAGGLCLPYHSTDFCFFSPGSVEIVSLGRVTAGQGEQIVATATVSATVEFGDIITHTTQEDFHVNPKVAPQFNNTVSFPVNLSNSSLILPDIFGGGVEPARTTSPNYAGLFNSSVTDKPAFANQFPVSAYPKVAGVMTAKEIVTGARTRDLNDVNNLTHQGIVSRRAAYATRANVPYFVKHAFSQYAHGTSPCGSHSSTDTFRNHNVFPNSGTPESLVGNYQGTIEFWVMLDEKPGKESTDQAGPVFGLIGVVMKNALRSGIENEKMPCQSTIYLNNPYVYPYHEGVAMYLYINSWGWLRFTRLYYAFCFDTNGASYGATQEGDRDTSRTSDARHIVRKDIEYDVSKWEPHTWHHIAMKWNDTSDLMELKVDGESAAAIMRAGSSVGYCILNEIDPWDSFFINGFCRRQVRPKGYFHFNSDDNPPAANYLVDIYFPGNATIDELISYGSSSQAAQNLERYEPADLTYTNTFTELHGIAGPLLWTSYPYAATGKALQVQCSVNSHRYVPAASPLSTIGKLIPQGHQQFPGNTLQYTATFTVDSAPKKDDGVVCPSLDSVSLVVLHNYPRFLNIRFQ